VALLVQRKVPTRELLRILPPAQRSTKLKNGRIKCNARARINEDTREWEVADCSKTFGAQYEYRRHLRTIHLGGDRWEQTQAAGEQAKSLVGIPLTRLQSKGRRNRSSGSPRQHQRWVSDLITVLSHL
jgi:hypothetical protein